MPETATRLGKRQAVIVAGFVVTLVALHLILMTGERHAAVMTAVHQQFAVTRLLPMSDARDSAQPTAPAPIQLLGDCPALVAITPLLAVLLVLLALVARPPGRPHQPRGHPLGSWMVAAPVPLMGADRRRAFLQVYLN